jgi:uroporphyrinogen decarboxylase
MDLKNRAHAGSNSALVKVLNGATTPIPPLWFMRQAGRYLPEYRDVRAKAGGFVELCLDPTLAAEVTLQPVRRFDLDAAIIFSDILIIPHALGVKLWFEEGEGPRLEPVNDEASFKAMSNVLSPGIIDPVYEALGRVRAELAPEKALIGFCGAPWTVATYLVAGRGSEDQAVAKSVARENPALFTGIIDRLADATVKHLAGQLRAGANLVQIFDTWAGSLDRDGFERWCVKPTARIVQELRKLVPDAKVIVFPKGVNTERLESLVKATGADGVSLDPEADRKQVRANLSASCVLQGNLSPETLLEGGAKMDREIDAIMQDMDGARHIFNLGHGILKETPIPHVERMIARVRG